VVDHLNLCLGQVLGSGCYGDVYKAKWEGTTDVAVKVIQDRDLADLLNEAAVLASLRHVLPFQQPLIHPPPTVHSSVLRSFLYPSFALFQPHIVGFYDIQYDKHSLYIIHELMDGKLCMSIYKIFTTQVRRFLNFKNKARMLNEGL